MTLLDSLYAQGLRAVREPRAAAADILALGVPREVVLPALVLVAILNVLLDTALFAAIPDIEITSAPLRSLVFYLAVASAFAFVLTFVGKWFEGVGNFEDALLLTVVLQAMMLPATAIQVALAFVSPDLAVLFLFVVVLFIVWIQINFVAALHGFSTLGRAVAVTLIASFIVYFIASPFMAGPTPSAADV
ncbi:MAG: YIP1 family protein [Pseudomonadota bacterium]